MARAAKELGINYKTLRAYAKKYGCFVPKQGLRGVSKRKKPNGITVYRTKDILSGKHPLYQTFKLKQRLFREGIKKEICEKCGIGSWQDKWLPLELEHKDGDKTNHNLENLLILCPNCHSQTPTYRAKNRVLRRKLLKEKSSKRGSL